MDPKFVEIAEKELNETDSRKSQSLAQFKEWLAKHPFLSKVRQDDAFLIQFLRARKYRMDDVFQIFENSFLASKKYPQFFEDFESHHGKLMKLLNEGCIYPLPDRDSKGRMIVIMKKPLNDFNMYDYSKLGQYVFRVLQEEEETQVAGVITIADFSRNSLKDMLPPGDMGDLMKYIQQASPYRMKAAVYINVPQILKTGVDIISSFFSEKIRSRIQIHGSNDDLKKSEFFDPNIFPEEYGGKKTKDEILKSFLALEEVHRAKVLKAMSAKDVNWDAVPADRLLTSQGEAVGSFRKLEID